VYKVQFDEVCKVIVRESVMKKQWFFLKIIRDFFKELNVRLNYLILSQHKHKHHDQEGQWVQSLLESALVNVNPLQKVP
jgi:hypothetical protein